MACGQKTDASVREQIICMYVSTGNMTKTARDLKVPFPTVRDIIYRARKNGDLKGPHENMRKNAMDSVERMMLDGCELAHMRLTDSSWAMKWKVDPSPQYLKEIVNAHRSLVQAERAAASHVEPAGNVTVLVSGPKPSNDNEKAA